MVQLQIVISVEEVSSGFVGVGVTKRGLACNTIPLKTEDEALADLRINCITAWGERVLLYRDMYNPITSIIASYIGELYQGGNPSPPKISVILPPREKMVRALRTVKLIPRGRYTTYAELARAIGTSPRAVGTYMAKNPVPLIIPCHRVVRSDLRVGGYSYGPLVKAFILMREGVPVDMETGRLDPSRLMRAEDLIKLEEVSEAVEIWQTRIRL